MTLLENNKRYFVIFVLNILPYHIMFMNITQFRHIDFVFSCDVTAEIIIIFFFPISIQCLLQYVYCYIIRFATVT